MAGTTATVCSMCGDVGFPEKLFRCARCHHRFQHSYCTNYYGDGAPASAGSDTCDWCLSDVGAGKARWSSSSSAAGKQQQHASAGSQESTSTTSSGGSGRGSGKASDHQQAEAAATGRRATTRAGGRRYKLLKDVLC
ncbi:hypothetical protein HU200_032756 [Digitaria exilis]|uniref:PHD-type zinc finger plants domain-containing protein n=1 Tax=Digitaria exilis TaxID=1010633 RepID=A0A835BME0_9POAL|nr:hypothetical protein HU200_032756 [Digitaria exilis]